MENIILAFSVVFPLVVMMSVGYLLKRKKITDDSSLNVMNKVIFKVFLPLLLFCNIYSLEPEEALNRANIILLLIASFCIIVIALLGHLVFSRLIKNKKKCSVVIQGSFRSNLVLFGIPIAASIYGSDRIGIVSMLAACIVPLFNVLAVIVLELYRGGKINYKNILFGILKNPLIISSALAILLLIIGIDLPDFVMSPINSMSKVATPLAFTVLGGTFQFSNLGKNIKYLITVCFNKLVLLPALTITFAYLLGFQGEALVALIGATASPAAVSSFSMAMEMDADSELAGQIVILTSIASIVTIFFWVLILKTIGLI
ncbi:MAG: family transporter [Herbinix sp.]|jgi:predicted permease|nr:family transporter [Herbinix sp.]